MTAMMDDAAEKGVESTVEFTVNMTCGSCVDKTRAALMGRPGVSAVNVDLERQSVLVTSSLPADKLKALIETTGKRAVVVGMGSGEKGSEASPKSHMGAAVAALGGPLGAGSPAVQGVVRFVQVDKDRCVVDGTIDGLRPGISHRLAVHESGDLSGGCATVGGVFNPLRQSFACGQASARTGDLGKVTADEHGRASFKFSNQLIKGN
jgi:copper chaperone for superoxide dismutase